MLKIIDVSKQFGGLVALNKVNMVVEKGEIRGLIGPNGSGKTTLINVITGFYKPSDGNIIFNEIDISKNNTHEIAKQSLVRTFQNINLFPTMTALENVLVGRSSNMKSNLFQVIVNSKFSREEEKINSDYAREILAFVGLEGKEEIRAQNLSYGQQRLLEIARAMATEPRVLLLDEPVAGMNDQESDEVAKLVKKLQKKGMTILLIEHSMRFVMNLCDKITVLNSGTVIADDIPEEIQKNEEVIKVYLGKGHKNA